MSKINIQISIENSIEKQKYKTTAILNNKTLKYKEENKTTVVFYYDDNRLIRENDEIKMECYFDENKGVIKIKELNKRIDLIINTKRIKRSNNNIEILYLIDNEEILYKVEEIK